MSTRKARKIDARKLPVDQYLIARMMRSEGQDGSLKPESMAYPFEFAVERAVAFMPSHAEAQFSGAFEHAGLRHIALLAAKIEIENAKRRAFGVAEYKDARWHDARMTVWDTMAMACANWFPNGNA